MWRTYFIDSIDNNYFRVWLVYSKEGRPCGGRILLIQWIITISECGMCNPRKGVPVEEVCRRTLTECLHWGGCGTFNWGVCCK